MATAFEKQASQDSIREIYSNTRQPGPPQTRHTVEHASPPTPPPQTWHLYSSFLSSGDVLAQAGQKKLEQLRLTQVGRTCVYHQHLVAARELGSRNKTKAQQHKKERYSESLCATRLERCFQYALFRRLFDRMYRCVTSTRIVLRSFDPPRARPTKTPRLQLKPRAKSGSLLLFLEPKRVQTHQPKR